MKLIIDTKKDSPEDIEHAITLLRQLSGSSSMVTTNTPENPNFVANFFGQQEQQEKEKEPEEKVESSPRVQVIDF